MSQIELHRTRLDAAFDVLSSNYRRRILFGLADGKLRVSDVAERLNSEFGDERDRIELALHTIHLPKLADFGFVEWHRGSNEIRRGSRFEDIRPLLDQFQ